MAVAANVAAGQLADYNGDGMDDVLLRDGAGAWHYYAMDGRDTLPELSGDIDLTPDPEWHFAGSGDFDGDGTDDVLLRHADGGWYYYAMDGGQPDLARSGAVRMTRNLDWRYMGSGEFTGDGKDDVLLRHRVSGAWSLYPLDGHSILPGGGFVNLTRNALWQFVGIGDLDGDGRDGVLIRHAESHAWHYYDVENRRATASSGQLALSRDPDWRFPVIGDFNGDGKDDVLLRRASDGEWYYYAMDGLEVAPDEGMADLPTGANYLFEAAGDLNGDGRDDVLLRHGSGSWHYYPMNGRTVDEAGPGELPIRTGWAWALAGGAGYWDERVDIVDPALHSVVAEALGAFDDIDGNGLLDPHEPIWPITPDDMERLVHLVVPTVAAGGIRDLAGLQFAVNLTYLNLAPNAVTDLTPLSALTRLQVLAARGNAITDVRPLAGLTALTALYLEDNDIDDVTPLGTLTNLNHLRLDANDIADIAPLAAIPNLETLSLDHNDVSDLVPLAAMTSLTELHLDANAVDSLAPLAALNGLTVLGLDYNGVTDLEPLSTLTSLTEVHLRGNRIRDLSPLSRLTRLRYLYLDANEIVEVGALGSLVHLYHLSLSGNAIVDITPLASASFSGGGDGAAERPQRPDGGDDDDAGGGEDEGGDDDATGPVLDLSSNDIVDISPLRAKNLFWLDVSTNDIRDFSALELTPDIEHLAIHNNPIGDLSPLNAMPELVSLSLGGERIADFTPIGGLLELDALAIWNSDVPDAAEFVWPGSEAAVCENPDADPGTLSERCALLALELVNAGTPDLRALSHGRFAALRDLALRRTGMTDLSALPTLAKVEALDVADNRVADLSGLRDLATLTYLAIGNNPVADIEPVGDLVALRSLIANRTAIAQLEPLANLGGLHEIHLDDAQVSDVTALAGLRGAGAARRYGLYLSRNAIADLSPLASIADVGLGDTIRVDGNPLDGEALAMHVPALRERGASVYVSGGVDIRDAPLRTHVLRRLGKAPADALDADDMLGLTELVAGAAPFWWRWDIANAPIRDLTGIEGAANLRRLHLDGQDVVDLTPLSALANLEDVRLNYNRVEDIGPLVDNPSLGVGDVVRLRGNPLSAESVDTHVPALLARGVVVHH